MACGSNPGRTGGRGGGMVDAEEVIGVVLTKGAKGDVRWAGAVGRQEAYRKKFTTFDQQVSRTVS